MQISTNYSNFSASLHLNKENKNVAVSEIKSNNINFQGLGKFIKPILSKKNIFNKETIEKIEDLSLILGITSEKLNQMAMGKTIKQIDFLSTMANRYNSMNFNKKPTEKEDVNVVLDLFNRVSSPKEEHFDMINSTNFSMTNIKKCFDRFNDDPKKLNNILNVYKNIRLSNKNDSLFMQILESPNTEEYVNNFDKYVSKIQVADNIDGIIAKFDKMIAGEKLSENELYSGNIRKMLDIFPKSSLLTKERFIGNYFIESENLLRNLNCKFSPTKQSIEEGDAKGILRIFNSTTKENAEFRTQFIDANYHNFGKRQNYSENEINELAGLLEYADKNKDAKEFLNIVTKNGYGLGKASDYIALFDTIGAEKLNKNAKSAHKVMVENPFRPAEAVLEYFEKSDNSFLGKIKSLFGKKTEKIVPVRDVVSIDTMSKLSINAEEFMPKPLVIKKSYITPIISKSSEEVINVLRNEIKPVISETSNLEVIKPKHRCFIFKHCVPAQPNAKKLVVINDVNNIIEKKLGSKTLSEQKSIYAARATKMRLGMLNEIFDSIKDTRKMERANGTFRKSKSVKNSDAIDLYARIRGNNKKLVNYMLKKRKADGTRQFSVKDIIETLKEGNKTIIENGIRRKDQKAVYDDILNQKIEQYGKLKTKKKSIR